MQVIFKLPIASAWDEKNIRRIRSHLYSAGLAKLIGFDK
jgi:hypothetical protein